MVWAAVAMPACRFGTAAVAAVVIGVEASPIPTPASSSPGITCQGVQPGWMWVSSESGRSGHHAGGNEWP